MNDNGKNLALPTEPGTLALERNDLRDGRYYEERRYHPASELNLASLLRIISEWRWLIISALAVGLALGVAMTLLTRPLYKTWVTIEVNPPSVDVSDEQSRQRQQGGAQAWDAVATQVGLLGSRSLAERVAQDLNLAADADFVGTGGTAQSRIKSAAGRIQGGLNVIAPEEGTLIRFSYVDTNPQRAARIANGIADSFINSNLQRKFEASAYARTFLQNQIAKVRGDLERGERQLVAYAQSQGIINTASAGADGKPTGDTSSLQGDSLVALNKALADATAKRVSAEGAVRSARLAAQSAGLEAGAPLRTQKAALEADYQQKLGTFKPEHPDMLAERKQIAELDRQIAAQSATAVSGRVSGVEAEYQAAVSAENGLRARVAGLKGSVLDLRGRSIQYNILQRDVDTNRSLYDALLQRYKEIGVAGGIGTAPVSVVDHADVPGGPFKPNLLLNLMIGTLAGLLAGIAAAVALELINDTIRNREDVRTKLGIACLGAIPKARAQTEFLDELRDPTSTVSEAHSAVLTSLRFSTDSGTPRVLTLTSARPAEGKSSTCLALAQNCARRGQKVLLIDADLRNPAFKSSSDQRGLTRLLTSHDKIDGDIMPTQHEGLWLLPCGARPPNPADLLSTGRFAEILTEALQHFDMVLVDAPPVLGLADAPLLAAACRNVMLVVEAGRTRTRAVIDALNRIEATGAQVIGATLTKANEASSGYGYGYSAYRYDEVGDKRPRIQLIPQQV
ncbi:GumC family protein [Sphingomonas ginkgonis]|uniref:GumC family protein n=1 Tax=Sphingomonas ginkgonis TaxID=2315330 RepID=UPI00163AE0FB|nr:polysaccharide biosynthesis tyrosine autokinase [Sphingomonas ginkgonis]